MNIVVRPNTAKEEFNYLKVLLNSLEFFKKNNYSVTLPNIPELNKPFNKEDEDKIFSVFENKEYNANFYKKGLDYLYSKKDLVENCISELRILNNFWQFKTFDTYEICLTKYGPGGSYNHDAGKIIMLVDAEGKFKRKNPEHTIIHEIAHIGVQESIVDLHNLTHWEIETLIDLIINIYLQEYLRNYPVKQITDNIIATYFINKQSIENLPNIIEEYVKAYPRKE